MYNRNFSNDVINKELYIQQQQDFQNLIINGNTPNCFIVKDLESSWGKTTFALNTLPLYKNNNPQKRVLYVSERQKQCTDNAEYVNNLFGKEVAKAIISGNSTRRKEYLQDYDIIFITQERYRRLGCKYNRDERDLFIDNRHLLIIDEKPEMCKEIKFSLTKNVLLQNEIFHIGGEKAVRIYNQIVDSLRISIESSTKRKLNQNRETHSYKIDIAYIDNLIKEFKEYMYSNVSNKSIFYQDYEDNNYQTILEQVEDLREFYIGKSIMCYDRQSKEIVMSVPNYSMEFWTLENNILMDATAGIDKSYLYNPNLFKICNENKVFKHHKWTLEWANVNTTTYGRENIYVEFKNTFNELVEELGEKETLVFAKRYDDVRPVSPNSKEVEKVNKFKGTVTHKGMINSNNEFEFLKNAINSDSNYEEEKSYVLKYLYYSGVPLKDWKRDRNGFTNKELEDFKIYDMARGLYQFFKRINRNMEFDSRLVLLTHKKEIVDLISNMLEGIECKHSKKIEDMFIKKNPTKVELFESMCMELLEGNIPFEILKVLEQEKYFKYKEKVLNGKIPKSVFSEALNMSIKSFGNNVINKKEDDKYITKEFLKDNGIDETYQTINFKNY